MKITIRYHRDKVLEGVYLPVYLLIKEFKGHWEGVGALVTLTFGFLCPIIGSLLSLIVLFSRSDSAKSVLNKVSVSLFVMTIPLLFLGSHLLDLLDRKKLEQPMKETQIQSRDTRF